MKRSFFWLSSAALIMSAMLSAQQPTCTGPGCRGNYPAPYNPGYQSGPSAQGSYYQGAQRPGTPNMQYAAPQGYALPQSNQGTSSNALTEKWDNGQTAMPRDEFKTDADRDLVRKIREAFHNRRDIDARKVIIIVNDKKVGLKGQVLSDKDIDALVLIAKDVANTKDINNQLTSSFQNGQNPNYQIGQPQQNDTRFMNQNSPNIQRDQNDSGSWLNQPSNIQRDQNDSGRWLNQPSNIQRDQFNQNPNRMNQSNNPNDYQGSYYSRSNNGNRYLADRSTTTDYSNRIATTPELNADNRISKKVKDLIEGGVFSKKYPGVTFDVSNNAVTLKGTVESESDRKSLQESVAKIDGVKNINNQIQVTPKK